MSALSTAPELDSELRCSPRADRRGDSMLGTAFPAARLLLVEQPYPWNAEGLRSSRFDRAVALALEARGRAEGVRVQAIRRVGRCREPDRRRWALVDTREASPTLRWGEYAAEGDLLELPLDGSVGQPDPTPAYLVCTHAKHDPCCGQRGRPLAAALRALRPDGVWQSSHLGGCRFAPTVLALPHGVVYGRVGAESAAALVAATEAGTLLSEHVRGRIGMPPAAQAAVAYAAGQLGLDGIRAVAYHSSRTLDARTAMVRVGTPQGVFEVTVDLGRVDAAGLTCAHPAPSFFVAHRPTAMAPVPST